LNDFSQFKNHLRLSDFDSSWHDIPDRAGVYIIRAVRKNGTPIRLPRLNGPDAEGILLIGKSKSVRRRLHGFLMDIRQDDLEVGYHSEGWTFRACFRRNRKHDIIKLNDENLDAAWKITKGDRAVDLLEARCLYEYAVNYQDKPPHNLSLMREDWPV